MNDAIHAGLVKLSPIDRQTAQTCAALEMGAIVEIVFGRLFGHRKRPDQPRDLGDQFQSRGEILLDVGPKVKCAFRPQDALDVAQKALIENPPFLVPGFPPRVGKIGMDAGQRLGRNVPGKQFHRVAMNHPAVGKTALRQPRGGKSGVAITDLDPQKIGVRLVFRGRCQKKSLPAADFHFDRRIATK